MAELAKGNFAILMGHKDTLHLCGCKQKMWGEILRGQRWSEVEVTGLSSFPIGQMKDDLQKKKEKKGANPDWLTNISQFTAAKCWMPSNASQS